MASSDLHRTIDARLEDRVVAKRRGIDVLRRAERLERKQEELGRDIELTMTGPDLDADLNDEIGDALLRLVFISCHPALSTEARVALTLRLLGG